MDINDYIFGVHPCSRLLIQGVLSTKFFIKKDLGSELATRLTQLAREPYSSTTRARRTSQQKSLQESSGCHRSGCRCRLRQSWQYHADTSFRRWRAAFHPCARRHHRRANFGAIARTAECCGVNAIVIPSRGSVSVGSDSVKTSGGSAELYTGMPRELACGGCALSQGQRLSGLYAQPKVIAELYSRRLYHACGSRHGWEDTGISPRFSPLPTSRAAIPQFGRIGIAQRQRCCGC